MEMSGNSAVEVVRAAATHSEILWCYRGGATVEVLPWWCYCTSIVPPAMSIM